MTYSDLNVNVCQGTVDQRAYIYIT